MRVRRLSLRAAMVALSFLLVAALAIGPLHIGFGSYDRRNGSAAALDDMAAGLPIKLYYHDKAQIDATSEMPGISCAGGWSLRKNKLKTVRLDQAAWNEGGSWDGWWFRLRRSESARGFAYLYNTTVLKAHHADLERLCPTIKAISYEPKLG